MAEDWIKMRKNLERHPKVLAMASAMSTDRFRIIGGLFAAWSLFDTYTEDGNLPSYSAPALGEAIGWPGFGEAMQAVEWLNVLASSLEMPRFDTHNGESAKKRAMDAERKRVSRASADKADRTRTGSGPEEEKRKRKKEQKPSGQLADLFGEFWSLFPARPNTSKPNRKGCAAKWKQRGLDAIADRIMADVTLRLAKDAQWQRGFPPNPETYLNQDRWDDGFSAGVPAPGAPGKVVLAPTKAEVAKARIAQVEEWATNMRAMDVPEAEVADQVARIRARYEPDLAA